MADLPPDPNAQPSPRTEARLRPDRQSMPGIPLWVKIAAAIAVVLVVGFVIIHLAGGRVYGPRTARVLLTGTRMTLSPPLRKLVVTAHVVLAVGWLGAVAAFLALAIAGVTSQEAQTVRAVYLAMALVARYVIVPLSFAPLITGPILSLGTPWGLFRHYWILAKLLITILSTIVLQVHMQPIRLLAEAASTSAGLSGDLHGAQVQMVVASVAALLALLAATALGVYKPRGMSRYGWRKQYEERPMPQP